MNDFPLKKYFKGDTFDFPALVNDDFLDPIHLLFQKRYFISTSKLLFIAIDSVGYLEFGENEKNPFISWLRKYADLSGVNATEEELWEHRNSLLHMSSLESRKVARGQVKKILMYIGDNIPSPPSDEPNAKYYNLQELILSFIYGCGKWFESYDKERDKIADLIDRYDLITSDARLAITEVENKDGR